MARTPLVSVILPVRDGARFLGAALDSMLGQTLSDLELIVIDDGSTDTTAQILDQRGRCDARLRVLTQSPRGLVAALNRGLDVAHGSYLARMDADDVAHPERLHRQVAFLEANPGIGIIGSGWTVIDAGGRTVDIGRPPRTDAAIRWVGLLTAPFAHPSVTLRRAVLDKHGLRYDPGWTPVEDFELWTRLLRVTQGSNLPEVLLGYRRHLDAVSLRARDLQLRRSDDLAFAAIREHVPEVRLGREEVSMVRACFVGGGDAALSRMTRAAAASRYLDLLDSFLSARAGTPGIEEARRYAATCAAVCALRAVPGAGSAAALRRSVGHDHRIWWKVAGHLRRAGVRVLRRIGRRADAS